MRQAIRQFQFNVEQVMSEVEIAVREVEAAHREMLARYQAMLANETDLNYFEKRWELLPGDDRSASFLLEDILEAHDRLAAEESNFAQTQTNYAMAIVNLKRALGILLQTEEIGIQDVVRATWKPCSSPRTTRTFCTPRAIREPQNYRSTCSSH